MLNINIGILGHVDSGKTSLAKALSEIASTAAFDKNPQSQARGITLDLGFSSFSIPTPDHLKTQTTFEKIQYTLVDCPGHASLIRTIIGGSQIVDMVLLVIDVTKGIQTQTAECLVIAEITCPNMIVVLNKIDLLEEDKRIHLVEKMKKRLKLTLASTKFLEVPIVHLSANPSQQLFSAGTETLVAEIAKHTCIPIRNKDAVFVFAVDHCFGIKGQGTVMTGTVLQGSVKINDTVEIPAINQTRKIKSMQMFKQPVSSAQQGDRLGICVTQFDPKLIERGIVCAPSIANIIYCAVVLINRVKYYKGPINTKSKFHITVGHETVIATVTCFYIDKEQVTNDFNFSLDYLYSKSLDDDCQNDNNQYYLLLQFEKPVLVVPNSTIIGSKLDMDIHTNECRIAFWGKLTNFSKDKDYKRKFLPNIKISKIKIKTGVVDRIVSDHVAIIKNMFKKKTNLEKFIGLKVQFCTGEVGMIDSSFGQSGKVKVNVNEGFNTQILNSFKSKNKEREEPTEHKCYIVELKFKKYLFDINSKIVQ